jgi:hypothetical protein
VTPKEQEIAIGELEERVDRLRNIYEQYFLGFEKLEPTVPRKDVDRRLAILRKEQIRNTAMRFRFQVVTQKYNTYAMHWIRICRQIEEGTYKRHIRKAKARFGEGGARGGVDADVSIDVEMEDYEDADLESVLADINASTSVGTTFDLDAADTIPPPPPPPPASVRTLADRTARGAALPQGAKPRILRKRDDTEPPPSAPSMPAMPAMPAASSPGMPPQSSPRLPMPSRPELDIPGGRPSGPRIQRAAPSPESSQRFPNAAPSPGGAVGAASAGRIPASTPHAGAPAAGRIPVAAPASPSSVSGASSNARMPVAPIVGSPSAGRMPIAPIVGSPPSSTSSVGAPSAGRIPLPAPAPPNAPSAGRLPNAPPAPRSPNAPPPGFRPPPGAPSAGGMKAAPPPPQSVPRIPPTSNPKPPMGNPRPPAPSVPDKDAAPASAEPRPSVRPRAPLPLPSQIARPTKKE